MIIFLLRLNLSTSRHVQCVLTIGLGVMVDGGGVTVDVCETEHSGWKLQLYKTVLSTTL